MASPWKARALPDIRTEYLSDEKMLQRSVGVNGMLLRAELEAGAEAGTLTARDRALLAEVRDTERFHSQIKNAELYWVTESMTALALEASVQMPPFVPAAEWPHPCGLIALAGGLPRLANPDPRDEGDTAIRMLMWNVNGKSIQIRALASSEDIPIRVADRMRRAGIAQPRWYTVMTLDLYADLEVDEATLGTEAGRACTFLLGAAWHLMQIPTLAETTPLPRSPGKRGRREEREQRPAVQIVDLRRLKEKNTEPGETDAAGRTYTHRWYVQGHWRRNVPSGPGRVERKNVYIEPYIKGPAGAPLLPPRARVNVWRR